MKENFKSVSISPEEKAEGAVVSNVPQKEVEFRRNAHATPEVAHELIADIQQKKKDIEAIFADGESDILRTQVEEPSILSPQAAITQQENKAAFAARKEARITGGGGGGKWFKRFLLAGGLFLSGLAGAKAGDKAGDNPSSPHLTSTEKVSNTPSVDSLEHIADYHEEIKTPEGYKPSTPTERSNWNTFLRYLAENKMAGNKELDRKDRSLGLEYLKKYNESHPNAQVPESYIVKAQYEHKMMRRNKVMPFLSKTESDKLVSTMPKFLDHAPSDEDNWLGSITSVEYYPEIIKRGQSYGHYVYNFGANYEDYLKFNQEDSTQGLEKKYSKYIVQPERNPSQDIVRNEKAQ